MAHDRSETKQQRIETLERLLEDARRERDVLRLAVRWALGENVRPVEPFEPRQEGQPAYYWRRRLRELAREGL